MNRRVSLESIAVRLRQQLAPSLGINRIGSALDFDFLEAVGDADNWPAVWVGAQKSTPVDNGAGMSGVTLQTVRVDVAIRVIVQRYVAGEAAQEALLNRIADAVCDALMGWRPASGYEPLKWGASVDGPVEQSVMTADLLFNTSTRYQYPARA